MKRVLFASTIVLIVTFVTCMIVFHSMHPPIEIVHRDILKILKVLDKVCTDHKLPYWIEGGTLLGAVRSQSIIPWDDDADIAMLEEDCEKLLGMDLSPYGIKVKKHSGTADGEHIALLQVSFPGKHHLAWVDIFPRRLEGDHYVLVGWPRKQWPARTFHKSCYDGHANYTLNGLVVRGPKQPRAYLENAYGKKWRTPKPTHIHTFSGFRGHPVYIPFMIATPLLLTGALAYSVFSES